MNNHKKLAGLAVAAIVAMTNNQVVAEGTGDCSSCDVNQQSATGQTSVNTPENALARQQLIDALKSMKNNPEAIEFHSAMCYKMAMPPDTFEYSCPDCGTKTTHGYFSISGQMAREIAGIKRSLPNLPTRITVSETSLCQKCGKGATPELNFNTDCGNCKTSFSWKITNSEDLSKIHWLFIKYPVTSLDIGPGKGNSADPERVKEMVRFVSGCVFCPACLDKLQLSDKK